MSDLTLNILIKASGSQASGAIHGVASEMLGMGGAGGIVAGVLMKAGEAAVEFGIKSTEMAGDFQTAALSLVAHAGLAKNQMDNVSASVEQMASQVGRSPVQLEEALYPILSAFSGIQNQTAKSAIALDTLKMSFEAVAGTTVNGTDVANAAVGTFNALGLATNNVSKNTANMKNLFDQMDLTVQLGNMQWNAYKNVISKLAVSIQGTGVKFTEASSALATLTNEGFSAQKAQTYLSNMFTTMAIKTDTLAKHAKKLGIAFDEQKYSSMNLADKIAYLNEVTGGNKQKILALLGNNATALKSFNALTTGLQAYKDNLKKLENAHGALQASFDTASQGMQFAWSRVKAGLDAIMIAIGSKLLPIVTFFITKAVMPLVTWLSNLVTGAGGVSNIFGKLGVNTGVLSQIWASLQLSLGYVKDTFMGIVTTLVGPVSGALSGANDTIKGLLNGGLYWLRDALYNVQYWLFQISTVAGPALSSFLTSMKAPFKQVSDIVESIFTAHLKTASNAIASLSGWFKTGLMPAIKQAMPGFLALGNTIMNTVIPALLHLWAAGQSIVDNVIPPLISIFEAAEPVFIRIAGIIDGGIAAALQYLIPFVVSAGQAVADFVSTLVERVSPGIASFFNGLNAAIDWLTPIWNAVWPAMSNVLKGSWDIIVGVVQVAWALLSGIVLVGLDMITGNWKAAWTDMLNMLIGVWNGIVNVIGGALGMAGIHIGTFGQIATVSMQDTSKKGSKSMQDMANNTINATNDMKVQAYNNVSYFASNTTTMLGKMGDQGKKIMQTLDQNVIGYWNDVAQYIADHPINADIQTSFGGKASHLNKSLGMQKNLGGYAEGGTNIKEGDYIVGEKGWEVMHVPGGSSITPHNKLRSNNSSPTALVKQFTADIASNTGKAQQAAQQMMSSLLATVQKYQLLLLGAESSGNKQRIKQYSHDLTILRQQLGLYKGIVKQAGDKLNLNNRNNPILFKSTTGVLNGPGSSTTSSGGTGTSGGSTPTYQIINNNTVEIKPTITLPLGTSKQDIQRIAHELDIEWGKMYRRKGINIPNSSGVAS